MEIPLRDAAPEGLTIIETLRFEPSHGFVRLDLHLDRAERTCKLFDIPFDRQHAKQVLLNSVGADVARCRLTIDKARGNVAVASPYQAVNGVWNVIVADATVFSQDPWRQIKTNQRQIFDQARANLPDDIDEVLFGNEAGELCEGSITNIFVDFGAGLLTPPVSAGVLPGVLRQEYLLSGKVKEARLKVTDLREAQRIFVGNSLRGLVLANLVDGA